MAVQTIEQTAKKFKLPIILSVLTILLGLILSIIEFTKQPYDPGLFVSIFASLCFFGGFIWLAVVKFLAWWHHG